MTWSRVFGVGLMIGAGTVCDGYGEDGEDDGDGGGGDGGGGNGGGDGGGDGGDGGSDDGGDSDGDGNGGGGGNIHYTLYMLPYILYIVQLEHTHPGTSYFNTHARCASVLIVYARTLQVHHHLDAEEFR